jgi:hypothetical protein
MLFWQISSVFSPCANLVPVGNILLVGGWDLCINDRVESPGYEFKKVADSATADYGVVAQFVGEECDAREAMADHQGTEKPNQPVL